MSKAQRMRALANVGTPPRPSSGREGDNSRSDEVAANSENSAFGSRPEGSPSPTVTSSPTAASDLTGYAWYEEYVALTQRFPWRLAAYIAWAASPVIGRLPATQWALAQVLGLKTDRTIRQWKEKDPTIEQVIEQLQAAPLWRHRRDLYEALVRTAVAGDVPALKLALEMTGDYTPRVKQTVDTTVRAVDYTADDLTAAERELGEWERGRQKIGDRR